VKEFLWFFGVVIALFLLGVLGNKFAPVGKTLERLWLAFLLPIYGLGWVLDNSVPEDEDALVAWAIVLIGVAIYSWKLLVKALLCYVLIFAVLKLVRWWDDRKRDGTA